MGKQKAPLDLVKMVLQRNALDVRAVSKILEDLHLELDNEVDDKPPPIKKQFVILQSEATRPDQDPVAWHIDDRIVHVKTNEKGRVIGLLYTTSELRIEWDTGRISDVGPSLIRITKGKDV